MGHMLNNTLQDVLIRRARMQGFNACWVPGTDHASIATEAKVVQKLAKEVGGEGGGHDGAAGWSGKQDRISAESAFINILSQIRRDDDES